ncbi:M48 family metalloprotease [Flavobacterium sp. SUN052]|uniref:M48 family metalloprotease n=1 Tax=Flavobacterium sp. SUN052 TaxID=3002441 RepID=UPI00237EE13D|nr:M48 family metalloprotease [Flavobacterium sp. SUN052]MEC4004147.1 M48 family metalloprotease [Flavobacterium sp. SUN052]
MKTKAIFTITFLAIFSFFKANAQISLGDRALGALQNGVASFTFSNEDAAKLSKEAVRKMDSTNIVAGPKDGYTLRLNRIFGKHANEAGLSLNYKVYLTKDVNAFATADGSVRVFSGLMDIMDDNQLLAVIGHEIGHVVNQDSKDAMKAAYRKAFVMDGLASQSTTIAKATDSQLGQIGSAIVDSHYSRKQESEADKYSYEFMKRNKYDVNAVESAFTILANMSGGAESNFLTQMMSSHPDPKERAETAKARATADNLYKAYIQKPINNKATTVKTPVKKTTKKKK